MLAGWPPLSMENGHARVLLADETEDVIDVPTLHVVGGSDPYILGAMALFNMCDEDCAELFDHGKGHTVPRDATTIQELCDAIARLVQKKERWQGNLNYSTHVISDTQGMKEAVEAQKEQEGAVIAIPLSVDAT